MLEEQTVTPFVETWRVSKPVVETGSAGLVATQHYEASDIGARVLAEGGNAVDAAVAAGLAIGAVEPWMSGLGGGGYLLVGDAGSDRVETIDFGMVAPRRLQPEDYPIESGTDRDLFGWPRVKGDLNVMGPHSIAVPGHVAGLAFALEHFGSRTWAESLAPAIELAERGLCVDWYTTLRITAAASDLVRFKGTRELFLPAGLPAVGDWEGKLPRISLPGLAQTLRRLATAGADDFYRGEIARSIVADTAALGGKLSLEDLGAYRVNRGPARTVAYRDARIHVPSGLTGGPTLAHALARIESALAPGPGPDALAYRAYARALKQAYAHRFAALGPDAASSEPACTTHISVVDRDGNLAALTQTLLSPFGSKVFLPGTGILMNNGIMWFDPRPGRPNSLGPARRPLSNMCPVIVHAAHGRRVAGGAAGGRRIMAAMLQLVSFLVDYGMRLNEAAHAPRIDYVPGDRVIADARLGTDVRDGLAAEFEVTTVPNGVYPAAFALPNLVAHDADGGQSGAAFVMSPLAKVSPGA